MRVLPFAVMAILTFAPAFAAQFAAEVSGVPRIVDADTIEIAGQKIRLQGIDAPETDQVCLTRSGEFWACGIEARQRLKDKTAGQDWTCASDAQDRYGRVLAVCYVDGEDIGRWLVTEGWAMAFVRYSRTYEADEAAARGSCAGLWAGAFVMPWDWRHRTEGTTVQGCRDVPVNARDVLLRR